MNLAKTLLRMPAESVKQPISYLYGSLEHLLKYLHQIEVELSTARCVGHRTDWRFKHTVTVPAYQPKAVNEEGAFLRFPNVAEAIGDVQSALGDFWKAAEPYLPEDVTAATKELRCNWRFDASLLNRTIAPFQPREGRLKTPRFEWDVVNRDTLLTRSTYGLGDVAYGCQKYLKGEEGEKAPTVFELPFKPSFMPRISLEAFFNLAQIELLRLQSGLSNIANEDGEILTFPSFYSRKRYDAPYQGIGDPQHQVTAAETAWQAMAQALDKTAPTFESLEQTLCDMPGVMLGSAWPDAKGRSASEQKAYAAFELQHLYFRLPDGWDEGIAHPTNKYGQLDWTTYRLARTFEHIALSIAEEREKNKNAIQPLAPEREPEIVRAFVHAAKNYGAALNEKVCLFCNEGRTAAEAYAAYEQKTGLKKFFSLPPKKPNWAQMMFGPEYYLAAPYSGEKASFMGSVDKLFRDQGLKTPWVTPEPA